MKKTSRRANRNTKRWGGAAALAPALVAIMLMLVPAIGCGGGGDMPRVIVLGIDGMDYGLTQRLIGEGKLPNLARLAEMGGFTPLETSAPPQSPVAWSNFISGMNPGGHGIFDFIHRDPSSLAPYLSTSRTFPPSFVLPVGSWRLPLRGGGVECLRRGPAFWQVLSEHGVPCTIYNMPTDFPPLACDARAILGCGPGLLRLSSCLPACPTASLTWHSKTSRSRIPESAAKAIHYTPGCVGAGPSRGPTGAR